MAGVRVRVFNITYFNSTFGVLRLPVYFVYNIPYRRAPRLACRLFSL